MFEKLKSGLNGFVQKISQKELSDKDINRILDEFVLVLVQNDVAYDVAKKICDDIQAKLKTVQFKRFSNSTEPARDVLHEVLVELLKGSGETSFFDILEKCKNEHRSAVILFVGVNGTGKTSSIAKIGHLLLAKGYSVVIAAADTYRTGSIEQIEEHARRIGIKTIKHDYGGDSAAVAFDALTGNDTIEQGRVFSQAIKLDGVILTKLDADTKGGSAISMATILGKPILFAAVGQNYEDLIPFNPDQMVAKIIT